MWGGNPNISLMGAVIGQKLWGEGVAKGALICLKTIKWTFV